ncbi:hypothetical protein SNE40_010663 [Patella caerulea]|uniref:Uncharacterized protein n=1 Tax=Patella caerulea TaxID=87958 RepID=A0AAN8K1H3_PATCE
MLVETTEHKPEYSTDQILGTVGGYLGLCLGASLLSVVEVIEILIVKACLMLKRVFCTTKTSKVESIQSS